MRKILAFVLIGSVCALAFAVLYGNSEQVRITAFGSILYAGSVGAVTLTAFISGLLICAIGSLLIGISQSFSIRGARSRERRMREGWNRFADAQLAEILGEREAAVQRYKDLLKHTPEATAVLAPLSRLDPQLNVSELPYKVGFAENGNLDALTSYLEAQRAERELAFVRACELYTTAYDRTKLPPLLQRARDAALSANLLDKAAQLQRQLAQSHKLSQSDRDAEAEIALRQLPTEPEQRAPALRTLVKQYSDSPRPVSELAELELHAGKIEDAALLLGRAAKLNPHPDLISKFESVLCHLPLDRALSIIDQMIKGAKSQDLLLEAKLAMAIHHRSASIAEQIWSTFSTQQRRSERAGRLGVATALLKGEKEQSMSALEATTIDDCLVVLEQPTSSSHRKIVGLAPQFSTP